MCCRFHTWYNADECLNAGLSEQGVAGLYFNQLHNQTKHPWKVDLQSLNGYLGCSSSYLKLVVPSKEDPLPIFIEYFWNLVFQVHCLVPKWDNTFGPLATSVPLRILHRLQGLNLIQKIDSETHKSNSSNFPCSEKNDKLPTRFQLTQKMRALQRPTCQRFVSFGSSHLFAFLSDPLWITPLVPALTMTPWMIILMN